MFKITMGYPERDEELDLARRMLGDDVAGGGAGARRGAGR